MTNFKNNTKKLILGIQHLVAMFGATVLVPILTGLNISVALFSAGAGTLIFHMCTKRKVPVFLGSSFAFIPAIISVAAAYGGDLRYAQGGIVVAGLIYVIVSFIVKKIGVEKITNFLPAQVVGPMIMVIGLNLIPTALNMAGINKLFSALKEGQGLSTLLNKSNGALTTVLIALFTLGLALIIKKVGRGFISQLGILIAVICGYLLSLSLGRIDFTNLNSASLFSVPSFTLPKFDFGAIMIIVPVVLAVFMEHIGDITTNGQVVGKNFIKDPGLNRTLLGDGLATLFAGFVGGPANTTYGENTGVLSITKNYDPSILRLAAIFAICLSFVGKLGALVSSIPTPVMGGISMMLFSMITLIGVLTLRNGKVKFNICNIVVIAFILFIGLAQSFFGLPIAIKLNEAASISGLSLAAVFGIILNLIFVKTGLNKERALEAEEKIAS